ncbi:MAG: type II toxin-antitoxin system RelE family toxin [Thermoplasmatota archaeon]
MRLVFEDGILSQVQDLPPGPRALVRAALAALREHDGDRPAGLDVKRLQGATPVFRIRLGNYRVVYARHRQAHRILKVFHRSEGYGWLERLG